MTNTLSSSSTSITPTRRIGLISSPPNTYAVFDNLGSTLVWTFNIRPKFTKFTPYSRPNQTWVTLVQATSKPVTCIVSRGNDGETNGTPYQFSLFPRWESSDVNCGFCIHAPTTPNKYCFAGGYRGEDEGGNAWCEDQDVLEGVLNCLFRSLPEFTRPTAFHPRHNISRDANSPLPRRRKPQDTQIQDPPPQPRSGSLLLRRINIPPAQQGCTCIEPAHQVRAIVPLPIHAEHVRGQQH